LKEAEKSLGLLKKRNWDFFGRKKEIFFIFLL